MRSFRSLILILLLALCLPLQAGDRQKRSHGRSMVSALATSLCALSIAIAGHGVATYLKKEEDYKMRLELAEALEMAAEGALRDDLRYQVGLNKLRLPISHTTEWFEGAVGLAGLLGSVTLFRNPRGGSAKRITNPLVRDLYRSIRVNTYRDGSISFREDILYEQLAKYQAVEIEKIILSPQLDPQVRRRILIWWREYSRYGTIRDIAHSVIKCWKSGLRGTENVEEHLEAFRPKLSLPDRTGGILIFYTASSAINEAITDYKNEWIHSAQVGALVGKTDSSAIEMRSLLESIPGVQVWGGTRHSLMGSSRLFADQLGPEFERVFFDVVSPE